MGETFLKIRETDKKCVGEAPQVFLKSQKRLMKTLRYFECENILGNKYVLR